MDSSPEEPGSMLYDMFEEPSSVVYHMADEQMPSQVSDSASQQSEVDLPGNETDPDRIVALQLEFKVDKLEELDLQLYLAPDGVSEADIP